MTQRTVLLEEDERTYHTSCGPHGEVADFGQEAEAGVRGRLRAE